MKVKKILIILLALISFTFLNGCFKQDRYQFPDGTFAYSGEPVSFYDDLLIDGLSITFEEISKEVYLSSQNYNVLKNHQNKLTYSVIMQLKYTIEEKPKEYEFEFLGKVPGQNDSYKIKLTLDNEDIGITGTLTMTLYFDNAIGSKSAVGSYAGRVSIYVKTYEINGIEHDDKYHGFPRDLEFIKLTGI